MTPEEQSTCQRITGLYESLREMPGNRSEILVTMVNVVREIGLLVSTIMGPRNKWKREKYLKYAKHLPFGYDKAVACLSVSLQLPEKADASSAARLFQVVVAIADDSPVERKPSKASRAASPAVIVFNALHSARVTVDNRLKDFASFDEVTQVEITAMLVEHLKWITNAQFPQQQTGNRRVYDDALGRYVDAEINEDNH